MEEWVSIATCRRSALNHLILIIGYVSGQTAGQEYPNELEECYSERDSSNDSQIVLHCFCHNQKTARFVHRGLLWVFQCVCRAVVDVFTAACGEAILAEVLSANPVSVGIDTTAKKSFLDVINSRACAVCCVVGVHRLCVGSV